MPNNPLTPEEVWMVWELAHAKYALHRDMKHNETVMRLCIAYAEKMEQFYRRKFNNSEGDDAIAFQEGGRDFFFQQKTTFLSR